MPHHERSPYIHDSLFKELDMPGLPVQVFYLLTTSVDLYKRFKVLSHDQRHQVVESFSSKDMVELFPDEKDRLAKVIWGIENNYGIEREEGMAA